MICHHTAAEAWNAVHNDRLLHPGLVFYAFYEKGPHDTSDNHLERMMRLRPDGRALVDRKRSEIAALIRQGYEVRSWTQTLVTRLAAGLGIESPTENGITLDHTHGLPILSGQTLKGIAQDQYIDERAIGGIENRVDRWAIKNSPEFIALFGKQTPLADEKDLPLVIPLDAAQRGAVVFLDALVCGLGGQLFDVDIINPHYQPYYSSKGGSPPADYYKPVPVKFLTVRAGTKFLFTVASRDSAFCLPYSNLDEPCPFQYAAAPLVELAGAVLKKALRDRGVGGKTRVGYGCFSQPQEWAG